MKTAISLPDQLFEQAEELAERLSMSRSQLYATALAEFTDRHRDDSVREKLDDVYDGESSSVDEPLSIMQSISIPEEEW